MTEAKNWGGKREGAGRKAGQIPESEMKTGRLVISCTKEQAEQIKTQAKVQGMSLSAYVIKALGKL